jgi:hypothetical protein
MGRRRPEPHRGRVDLPVEDVPALVVGVLVLAAIAFALFGGRG